MKNFRQEGDVLDLTAPYDRTAGQGCLVGSIFGVAATTVTSGSEAAFCVEGVFDLTKKSGDTPSQGTKVYWDDTNKYVTTTTTSNTLIGVAVKAAAAGDATVSVRLNASF